MLKFLKECIYLFIPKPKMIFYCPHCDRLNFETDKNVPCYYCQGETIQLLSENGFNLNALQTPTSEFPPGFLEEYMSETKKIRERYYIGGREKIAVITVDSDHKKMMARYEAMQPKAIKCPNCQSTNVDKIGALERGASVAMLGIASGKIGKNFKCKSCGNIW